MSTILMAIIKTVRWCSYGIPSWNGGSQYFVMPSLSGLETVQLQMHQFLVKDMWMAHFFFQSMKTILILC